MTVKTIKTRLNSYSDDFYHKWEGFLRYLIEFNMLYVRLDELKEYKTGHDSHGCYLEINYPQEDRDLEDCKVFVHNLCDALTRYFYKMWAYIKIEVEVSNSDTVSGLLVDVKLSTSDVNSHKEFIEFV